MLYVKEIFKSIQGEGFYTGKNAVFVDLMVVIYGMAKIEID